MIATKWQTTWCGFTRPFGAIPRPGQLDDTVGKPISKSDR